MRVAAPTRTGLLALALAFSTASASRSEAAPKRFFVMVHEVDEAPGVDSSVKPELKALFIEELGKHPELVMKEAAGMPADPAKDPAAFKAGLHKMGVDRGLELTLRILSVTKSIEEPQPGKHFRVLKRGVTLSVFGDTVPEKVMAIGGDGDATVGVEIAKNADEIKEGKAALLDAAKSAITQAVDMTVQKLEMPPPKDPKKKAPHKK